MQVARLRPHLASPPVPQVLAASSHNPNGTQDRSCTQGSPGIPHSAPEIPRILRLNDAKTPVPPDHLARRSRDNCPHAYRGASYACLKLRGAALCVLPLDVHPLPEPYRDRVCRRPDDSLQAIAPQNLGKGNNENRDKRPDHQCGARSSRK